MKASIAATSVSLALATALVVGLVPYSHASDVEKCSSASLHGSYGYTAIGTLLPAAVPPPFAGPFGEVGRQTFDGRGNTTAVASLSANGNIIHVTITGTYTVNADCTATMSLNVSPIGVVANAYFVIDDNGLELRAISTDDGVVETRVYKKQFRSED